MSDAPADAAVDALRHAEARFRSGVARHDDARSGLVAAAVALLVAGHDSQALRELAAADRADRYELDRLLIRTLRGLGLDPLSTLAAGHRVAEEAAIAYLTGACASDAAAAAVWQGYLGILGEPGEDADDAATLTDLALTADGVLDRPELVGERDFFVAARRYLEARGRLPPADRLRSLPMPAPTPAPDPRPRPLIERIGMAALALVLAAMFALVAAAAFVGGEPFLGVMSAIGCLMVLWVGGLTLLRG